MSTISGPVTNGVTLGQAGYSSPLTITAAGTVSTTTGVAVYAASTYANPVVLNQGTIIDAGDFDGVKLLDGGSITNTGTGSLIYGYIGIYIGGATGTVTNSGTITASGAFVYGVVLGAAGSIDNTGLIQGAGGVSIDAGTVTNSATITGTSGTGVVLGAGGSVGNTAGLIQGASGGVYIGGSAGTVTNSGTIAGTGSYGVGVFLGMGGSVDNAVGLIEGVGGVYINGGAVANSSTVTNSGTISGTSGYGVVLFSGGGSVRNSAGLIQGVAGGVYVGGGPGTVANSATIAGTNGYGVRLLQGGTVFDSGTITGGNGTAIYFGGTGDNLLVLGNGYSLGGTVVVVGAANTLRLIGTAGAVTVDLNSHGLINFGTVAFGPSSGNNETLTITNTLGTVATTISDFAAPSDVIDLTQIGTDGAITNNDTVGHRLTITGSGGAVTLQLDASDGTNFTTVPDGNSGTELIACYCRGTLILTDAGELAVEALAIGGRVVTLSGEVKPIKWIGRRIYDGRFIAGNRAVLPIRIAADALADGVPVRDLCVSPGHALYINGVLAPAEHLVNGATIVQADSVDEVEYFHIELDTHDIMYADGAPAESFVDCHNRLMFANGAEYSALYPEDNRPSWEFCRPRVDWGCNELTEIRAALLWRADALGYELDLDPDLHLIVDGEIIRPHSVAGGVYHVDIPAGASAVWLASRSTVPTEVVGSSQDRRRLGVPVERIALNDGNLSIEAWHGHSRLCEGFHEDEASHRWTDGLARLPGTWLCSFPGAVTLEIHLAPSGLRYRLPSPAHVAAAA